MSLIIPEHIKAIKPYPPGKPIEELEREMGIQQAVKLASNENPLGPSPMAVRAIQYAIERLHRYPDSSGYYLIAKLSEKFGFPPEQFILGNGSDDIIGLLARALLTAGDEAVMPSPSFLMYEIAVRAVGAKPVFVPLRDLRIDLEAMQHAVGPKTRLIFITNPNNPTGLMLEKTAMTAFLETIRQDVVVVMDEAYIDFATDPQCFSTPAYLATNDPGIARPVVALRTFSKAYGLAGLRIGFGLMPAMIVDLLNRIRDPFNTNTLAQVGAAAALDDKTFYKKTLKLVREELEFLYTNLEKMGVVFFPTQANFFLIDTLRSADEVYHDLLKQGVIVRPMTAYGFPSYIRVNVGLRAENQRFLKAFNQVLTPHEDTRS